VVIAGLMFSGLVLFFTFLGVLVGPPAAKIGSARPLNTIPGHLDYLIGAGLLLGAAAAVFYGRRGLPLVLLGPVVTVLLDLDHLPVYLGVAQPIRPAHSLIFIVFALSVTATMIKRLEVNLVVLSSFLSHMAIDTGYFAPFSPLSFDYVPLNPYSVPFGIGAVLAALLAGLALRKGWMIPFTIEGASREIG